MTPVYRPVRAVSPYGNAPASRLVATGMGAWKVQLPGVVPPWLPQGSTMAYGRLGIAPNAMVARRPFYGAMDPVTAIADAVGSIFNFSGQIATNVSANKDRKAQIAQAEQQQKLMYLQLQQSTAATASSERTTILLVGGGLAAIVALGAFVASRPRKNSRRRNRARRNR